MAGRVVLSKEAGAWILRDPAGAVVHTPGTQTDGLQEAVNLAASGRWQLEVVGGACLPGSSFSHAINCAASINVPPVEGVDWDIGAVDVRFGAGVTYALVFDSLLHSRIRWGGRITFSGQQGGAAVAFSPRNPFGGGAAALLIDNDLWFQRIHVEDAGGNPAGAYFSPVEGTICRNKIAFVEIEGGHGSTAFMGDGIYVRKPQAGHSFSGNEFNVRAGLVWSGAFLRIGEDGAGMNGPLERNVWNVNMEAGVPGAVGISSHASRDIIVGNFRAHGYAPPYAAMFHAGTSGNLCLMPQRDGGVLDYGSGNTLLPQ